MTKFREILAENALRLACLGLGLSCAIASAGCATVRPEQRAILADPTMQFEDQSNDQAALEHALDNREGSTGGGSVRGGGCGCN